MRLCSVSPFRRDQASYTSVPCFNERSVPTMHLVVVLKVVRLCHAYRLISYYQARGYLFTRG